MGHIRMMGAVQPFLSGAISKTVNMPEAATAEEIETVYLEGWKQGLKAIAIYRDGSKRSQPLSTGKKKDEGAEISADAAETIESLRRQLAAAQVEATRPHRHRLPAERSAVTHKFDINGHEGYITVGLYPDGQPGEIFLKMAKEGSTISGLMDTLATSVSLALQYGVPLRDVVNKFAHVRFEPSGFTGNPEIPIAKSLVDYIFRWLGSRFLPADEKGALGLIDRSAVVAEAPAPFGASALRPRADEGITAQSEAINPAPAPAASPAPAPAPASDDSAKAVASVEAPAAPTLTLPRGELVTVASGAPATGAANGHANGNGNGKRTLESVTGALGGSGGQKVAFAAQADAPSCAECGSIMIRSGSCYKCLNCGATSGCS
jgi:ribonucleoside-diphosphate reductase alpha chain